MHKLLDHKLVVRVVGAQVPLQAGQVGRTVTVRLAQFSEHIVISTNVCVNILLRL